MTALLLESREGVTLIGGGQVTDDDLAQATALAPVVMAADSGADRALAAGLMPWAVAGDLDSISAAGRAAIPAERLHRIAEQETTDFEKCLTRIAAPFVVAVGFGGPRVDHLLANLTTLTRSAGPRCLLLTATDVVFAPPPRLRLKLPAGTRLSLYPLGRVSGESDGLRWPIGGLTFEPTGQVGTSNETTGGPVRLALSGACVLILPRRHLAAALDGLTSEA